jgi:CRP-like cAMP-binding protein
VLGAAVFRKTVDHNASLRAILLRYTEALHLQVSQTATCNGRHKVEDRLARWLLEAHDRAISDELPLTHEFLSQMLGSRRAGVSDGVKALQKSGAIKTGRSRILVTDRKELERQSCECYDNVKAQYARLLPS